MARFSIEENMSHFTILVKIKKDRLENHDGNLESALHEMLIPYQENNMGDAGKKYLKFNDCTDEIENSRTEVIEVDDHLAKNNPEAVGKTLEEFYGSFDELAQEYHNYDKDPETGKYGYWDNPNAKWDWYQIGGRWSGMLPVKVGAEGRERSWYNELLSDLPETADFCQVKDLNIEKMEQDIFKKIEEFWVDYQMWLEMKDMSHREINAKWGDDEKRRDLSYWFHDRLMKMGIAIPREPMVDAEGQRQKFSNPVFEYKNLQKQELYDEYRWFFEFSTFGVLDDEGWKEKGKMGWWGLSSDSTEDREAWSKSYFQTFIAHEDPETTIVVVDCHI